VGNIFTLRSLHGSYLYTSPSGKLRATPGVPKEFNKWFIDQVDDDTITIKSMDGMFLRYDPESGIVSANGKQTTCWVRARIFNKTLGTTDSFGICTATCEVKWLAADPDGNIVLSPKMEAWFVEPPSSKWARYISELYAELEELEGWQFVTELNAGVLVVEPTLEQKDKNEE